MGKTLRPAGQEGRTELSMTDLAAFWPFRPSRAQRDGEKLLAVVTQIARQPAFFGEGRALDTLQGRLELMMLHASLAFIRMRAEQGAEPLAQVFADKLFAQFDSGLREAAVGDLSVPKRMRKIARSFYGRLEAYGAALKANDRSALTAAIVRNVFAADAKGDAFAALLAAYTAATAAKQAAAPLEALFTPDGWDAAPD